MAVFTLTDGRKLTYECYGDPKGVPVLFSHGLSDSRFLRHWDDDLTKELGVYIVSVDQPGVGGSSPPSRAGRGRRTLRNYAKDVEELIERELRWERFAVAGHSGGGPHALALAAHMPGRVTRGVLAAPAPPIDGIVDKTSTWMFKIFILAGKWRCLFLLDWLCVLVAWWANRGDNLSKYLHEVATSDRTDSNPETFLGNPRQTEVFRRNFAAGLEQGAVGLRGMLRALLDSQGWGFSIREDIPQKIDVFVSDLDPIVSVDMGQCMVDAMPHADLHIFRNAGHYSFVDRQCWIDFFSVLVKREEKQ